MFDQFLFYKSIAHKIYSSIITFAIAYMLTHNVNLSITIGLFDSFVKIFLYRLFDFAYNKRFGQKKIKPCVIFLTGYSGSGKTTIANDLIKKLKKMSMSCVLLDGDTIRNTIKQHGFDEVSRKTHNLNVGYMASSFENNGNIVIVSLIAPYEDTRNDIRKMCKSFVEVFVDTEINVCIKRDSKGLYKKAMIGELKNFTGISAPYYKPKNPEIIIQTKNNSVDTCSEKILKYIKSIKQ